MVPVYSEENMPHSHKKHRYKFLTSEEPSKVRGRQEGLLCLGVVAERTLGVFRDQGACRPDRTVSGCLACGRASEAGENKMS